MADVTAHTNLPGVAFAPLRQVALAEALEQDLEILRDSEAGLSVQTYYGRICFAPSENGTCAEIHAPQTDFLQTLKDSLVSQISALSPDVAQGIRWSDASSAGQLPANARLMSVVQVERLDGDFLRVTLQGDVSRFTLDAIHFRLGIPPQGRPAIWPAIGPNGATQWPKGADALHLPVYTARFVRPDKGELVFDLFRHDGGRATHWAETTAPGDEVLVTGPGGGGCRVETEILGFADETGFPAVARILEANPGLVGRVTLFPGGPLGAAYPLPAHPGVQVDYAEPGTQALMAKAALAEVTEGNPPFLWFAAERSQATEVRSAWRKSGRAAKDAYISAYWQRRE
ncbi:siderophore-interacting protein [Roseovarius sp. MMSF_3281]|uniref:siderophore-interacting protein n=1 Tax=Roseovarius sp. MMSF_3281 TaxID=3046694 RepID=UPI00273FED45|nr:siderophore-interacting protein [Roseovarius sp. MMSF_3281]